MNRRLARGASLLQAGALRDALALLLGRGLLMLTSVVSIRVYTTLLTPQEIGRYSLLVAIGAGLTLTLVSPVGLYWNRKFLEWRREGTARQHLIWFGRFVLVVTGLAFALITLIQFTVGLGIQISVLWLLVSILGTVFVTTLNSTVLSALNFLGHRGWFVLLSNLTVWIGLAFSTGFAWTGAADGEHWLLGITIGQLSMLLVGAFALTRALAEPFGARPPVRVADPPVSVVFQFAWPLVITTGLYWAQNQGYRFVLNEVGGLESVGYFAVGFAIGVNVMTAFDTVFTQFYHPIFYQEIAGATAGQQAGAWNRYARIFLPALILVAAFVAGLGAYLAQLLTGAAFHGVGVIVVWGVVAEALRQTIVLVSLVAHARLAMRGLILPSLVGAGVSLVSVAVFAHWDPLNGTGLALAIGGSLWLILVTLQMRRLLAEIRFPIGALIRAGVLALPLLLAPPLLKLALPEAALPLTLAVMIAAGVYLLAAQYTMARPWLPQFMGGRAVVVEPLSKI